MKKLGNVLYIMTPDSYLYCRGEAIGVKIGGEEKASIPSHTVESIILFGSTSVSGPFIQFCGERGIALTFCSDYGRFYGRIYGPVSGNVLLRKKQYEICGAAAAAGIVRNILLCKFLNSKSVLQRSAREGENGDAAVLAEAAGRMADCAAMIENSDDVDYMRGVEGVAAAAYFGAFEAMQKSAEPELLFERRTKHPPENRFNALLSFLYMLLKNDSQSALETVGLDPAMGYMHTLRPGRPSLALDLMEELRSPLCDRLALSLVNTKQLKADDFSFDNGMYKLDEKARRAVLDAWQKRKKEEITHPYLKEKIPVGLIPYTQALLLARHIRGDIDGYPPFIWK